MVTLDRAKTCRFLAHNLYSNQPVSSNIPDFFFDAYTNPGYSNSFYNAIVDQNAEWLGEHANGTLRLTDANGGVYTPSGISTDTDVPKR